MLTFVLKWGCLVKFDLDFSFMSIILAILLNNALKNKGRLINSNNKFCIVLKSTD